MQNVGTPRFIIDWLSWWKSLGLLYGYEVWNGEQSSHSTESEAVNNVIGLNPSSQTVVNSIGGSEAGFNYQIGATASFPVHDVNIAGLLGHNFASISEDGATGFSFNYYNGTNYPLMSPTNNILINASVSGTEIYFQYDGFSLWSVSDSSSSIPEINDASLQPNLRDIPAEYNNSDIKLGSLLLGRYYDMPHSPDLNLTMTREYGGVKTIETKGGASLSNSFYRGSPAWGDAGAWELYTGTPPNKALSRSGRRVWDLSFSYLQDSDLFPDVSSLSNYETAGYSDGDSVTDNTLLNEDTFYSQVIHKTNGGQLPFIFQPDKDNNNPDQFAIAKLDMNSFKFSQKSFNTYDISLKIREVW